MLYQTLKNQESPGLSRRASSGAAACTTSPPVAALTLRLATGNRGTTLVAKLDPGPFQFNEFSEGLSVRQALF